MKKVFVLCSIIFLTISLGACGDKVTSSSGNTSKEKNKEASQTQTQKEKSTATFKNGVFKTKNYTMTIVDKQVAKNEQQDEIGLIVWYTVKNTSDKDNVVPQDAFVNVTAAQNNDTSKIELEDTFDAEDALYPNNTDSAEIKKYNEMIDIEKLSEAELLPGKTVKTFIAYELDNDKHDVTLTATDPETMQKIGTYTIKLN